MMLDELMALEELIALEGLALPEEIAELGILTLLNDE